MGFVTYRLATGRERFMTHPPATGVAFCPFQPAYWFWPPEKCDGRHKSPYFLFPAMTGQMRCCRVFLVADRGAPAVTAAPSGLDHVPSGRLKSLIIIRQPAGRLHRKRRARAI